MACSLTREEHRDIAQGRLKRKTSVNSAKRHICLRKLNKPVMVSFSNCCHTRRGRRMGPGVSLMFLAPYLLSWCYRSERMKLSLNPVLHQQGNKGPTKNCYTRNWSWTQPASNPLQPMIQELSRMLMISDFVGSETHDQKHHLLGYARGLHQLFGASSFHRPPLIGRRSSLSWSSGVRLGLKFIPV